MKQGLPIAIAEALAIAPARGRGLKRLSANLVGIDTEIAPARGRGLKPFQGRGSDEDHRSPPRGGAD